MDDEDLARAIALSLQDNGRSREVIEILDSDSEPEDEGEAEFQRQLQLALEASKSEEGEKVKPPPPPAEPPAAAPKPAFLSERAKMEQERLERQRKLDIQQGKLPQTASRRTTPDDSDYDSSDDERPPLKRPRTTQASSIPAGDETFWDGEIRQTATRYAEPRADGRPTFRLSQILGKKGDLAFAIISSFATDIPWLYEHMLDQTMPLIIVDQPSDQEKGKAAMHYSVPGRWIRTIPYLPGGYGCQHMKFMLLFHKTGRLRVVVSTANLYQPDWRDNENTVWLQDVPLRPVPGTKEPSADDFVGTLQSILHSVNVAPALKLTVKDHPNLPLNSIDDLRLRWDWSKVKAHLVPSIAGRHEAWPKVIKTGHPRLMTVVRRMALRTGNGPKPAKTLTLECQGSSVGSYTTQWLNEFYHSARGESAEDWLDRSKKQRENLPIPPIKLVYPTKKTVLQSELGEMAGSTIFFRRSQWETKTFPQGILHDSKSKGGNVTMHSKMIIGTLKDNGSSQGSDDIEVINQYVGWAYIGSHNFTPSAWGMLSGSAFNPVLNLRNYELGIVVPLRNDAEVDRIACFQRPPRKYVIGKDEPWFQDG